MEITIKLASLITALIGTGLMCFILGVFVMALLRMAKTPDAATELFIRMDEAERAGREIK
jgi:uncharacterized membrane protein